MDILYRNTNAKTNSVNKLENDVNKNKSKITQSKRLSREWIFSLTVFLILLFITIEKVYFSYVLSIVTRNPNDLYNKADLYNKVDVYNKTNVYNTTHVNNKADVKISSNLYDYFTLSNIIVNVENAQNKFVQKIVIISEKFANIIYHCYQVLYDALLYKTYDHRYLIMILGIILGVITTFVSWFIIYMDSRIPGNDPAFPFFLQKYWIKMTLPINLNYFVGALIGLLITICYLYENHNFDF